MRGLAGSSPRRPDRRLEGGAGGVPGETSKSRHPVHQKQAGQAAPKVDVSKMLSSVRLQFRRCIGLQVWIDLFLSGQNVGSIFF